MKKILFYGNCQLGALSRHIRNSSNEYLILNCKDYGLKPFWLDDGLFATWSPDNKDHQNNYYCQVIEAVRNCDIFIFQHHKHLVRKKELTTEYLINELRPNAIGICLPSMEYYGYLYETTQINGVITKLYTQGMSIKDMLYYLRYENDTDAQHQMIEKHNASLLKLKEKDIENLRHYPNYIPMSNFIEAVYDTQIIAYDHSHPSMHYYNEIINQLKYYGINITLFFNQQSKLPRSAQLCPYDLKYFTDHFTTLEDTQKHNAFFPLRLNETVIHKQIELIHHASSTNIKKVI